MIRAFGLRDGLAVHLLQRDGVWLDLFHHLLLRRSALQMALLAPVPWVGAGLASYVWTQRRQPQAFVQLLKRPRRQEADLLFMAPSLNRQPHSALAWQELLRMCAAEAAAQGLRRLFASLPEQRPELDMMTAQGWTTYTTEEVFVLAKSARRQPLMPNRALRPRQEKDVWWLRRLYSLSTPPPVQHAEGYTSDDDLTLLPLAWWEMTNQSSFVVEEKGDVLGGVQLVSGHRGHWLLLHGDPGNAALMTDLLRYGVAAAGDSRWPIYCAVRAYQGGLDAVVRAHGFASHARRSRLIKHLAVRVKAVEPAPVLNLVTQGPGS
ncbi:MAG: hypothetical protein WAZ19_00235 [Anaerolineae bacterium]